MTLLPLFNSKIHSVFLCSVPRLFPFCCLYFFFIFLLSYSLSWHGQQSGFFSSIPFQMKSLRVYYMYMDGSTNLFILCRLKHTRKIFSSLNSDPFRNSIQHFFYGFRRKTKKEFFFVKKKRLIVQLKVLFISMSKY